MRIETKFAFGEKVWTVRNSRAVSFCIRAVSVDSPMMQECGTTLSYSGKTTGGTIVVANETDCFASKEELLSHIASDDGRY